MTIRLSDPNIYHTETLLGQVLAPIITGDERVAFLVEPGQGIPVIQRLRVMMSRKRKNIERKGKRMRQFRLHATVHPETHEGKRFDCIVMWKSIHDTHLMTEALEDMLSHG